MRDTHYYTLSWGVQHSTRLIDVAKNYGKAYYREVRYYQWKYGHEWKIL